MSDTAASSRPLSPWWRHAAILVMIFGFAVLSVVTAVAYKNAPPIPEQVVGTNGAPVFTRADIEHGQEVFLKYGLMEHGTLWGHGAYLGPDYSAEYLHRLAEIARDTSAQAQHGVPFAQLDTAKADSVSAAVARLLKENRYDPDTHTLRFTPEEAAAYAQQREEQRRYFNSDTPNAGLPAHYITSDAEIDALTAYFAWAAWATTAVRPGTDASYTNNWPYEPMSGNLPAPSTYLWSGISVMVLVGGLGLVMFVMGRFPGLGWKSDEPRISAEERARAAALTPSQRATRWFFVVVALLFLLQSFAGAGLAHYRVEPGGFYGIDLARWLSYPLLRTWHLQLAVFWIATAWVAGGLFLAPMFGGEPKRQSTGAIVLLGALAVVVFGSLFGELLGLRDMLGSLWFWLGHQGSEYLDLGRFWQLLLAAGLIFWLFLLFRALLPAMKQRSELASLLLYAAAAIPIFYVPALFYGPKTHMTVIDVWRFWIIHLWVEGFFELFATVLVAVMFYRLGLVGARTATRVVYLDAMLFLGTGIVGTGHHWYFTGQSTLNMGLASCFSALEVVPLTLLTTEAWEFMRLGSDGDENALAAARRHHWTIRFLVAVGVWNFIGAGVFGFLINLPIVSYYEMGTGLTANHGHAAMFGVFGMLALATVVFCLRSMHDDASWLRVEPLLRLGFWGLNIGLALMLAIDLFPAGILQLWDALANGYWHARRLTFLMSGTFHTLEWLRIIGDSVFLLFGVLPTVVAVLRAALMRATPPDPRTVA